MTKQLAAQLKSLAEMARRENVSIELVPVGLMLRVGTPGGIASRLQLLPFDRLSMMTIDEVIQFAKGKYTP